MPIIDLRSDTVTKPTAEMREAMAKAEVGDDVYQDDPTVNELQVLAASMLGKEEGLFVPSGTMGNLAAILAHCSRGDEVIMGQKAHTFLHEGGGISTLGGVHSCQIKEQADGSLDFDELEAAIRFDDIHEPVTRLIEIENTHNACGGVFQTPEYINKLSDFAHDRGLIVHMDGARVFNSAIAQGIDVSELTGSVDSVTFCLSKGLCAPVGSVLCGDRDFIRKANRIRKHLGGGMRQAGILAAAGIIALNSMIDRLADDHIRAKNLAAGLKEINNIQLLPEIPSTNMVFFNLSDEIKYSTIEIEKKLESMGVLAHASGPRRFRLVTHYWITDQDVNNTVDIFKTILA